MLSTAIVIFREAFEIALIVGIVLAATRGLAGRAKWVWLGAAAGVAGAGVIAMFAEAISNMAEGMGQEIFNAGILVVASVFIGWTVIWMSTHARQLTSELRTVGKKVVDGALPGYSLSIIIGVALLREGAEIVLFTYGMLASGQEVGSIALGALIGTVAGLGIGGLIYFGLISIPTKYVFRVTSWLLILLVAGLATQAVGYLSAAGYFAEYSNIVWDSSHILSEESVTGQVLHGLVGYTAQPSEAQLFVFVLAICVIAGAISFLSRRQNQSPAAVTSNR